MQRNPSFHRALRKVTYWEIFAFHVENGINNDKAADVLFCAGKALIQATTASGDIDIGCFLYELSQRMIMQNMKSLFSFLKESGLTPPPPDATDEQIELFLEMVDDYVRSAMRRP